MNERFDANNFLIIAVVGIVILTCLSAPYSSDGASGPASAALWGYGLILFAAMGLTIYAYKAGSRAVALPDGGTRTTENEQGSGMAFVINAVLSTTVPGCVAVVVFWLFMLNVFYFRRINEGRIPTEYYTYQQLSLLIVSLQLLALYKFIQSTFPAKDSDADGGVQKTASALVYLLGTANAISAGIMTIILKFFTTDG